MNFHPQSLDTKSSPLRDFPDGVNPMLVKELRQGLRSRLFSVCLIGLHLALLLWFGTASIAQLGNGASILEGMNALSWGIDFFPEAEVTRMYFVVLIWVMVALHDLRKWFKWVRTDAYNFHI